MFSLAYVILPFDDVPPAEAITASLARFQRGGRGDVPDEWLRFEDETAHAQEVHHADITFIKDQGLRTEGVDSWYLNTRAIIADMDRRGTECWSMRFADVVPDIAEFVGRYMPRLERHPVTGGFGQWHNALGRWDWWDLGGRFNGSITGERKPGHASAVGTSGPSEGRAVLERIEDALATALDSEPTCKIDVLTDENVELVDHLARLADDVTPARRPGVLVLPPGLIKDELRWVGNWPEIGPLAALPLLGLPMDAKWPEVVKAAYRSFPGHWAAGVALHH